MGNISLYQKRARNSSGWGNWGTISGADYASTANAAYVVYSAAMNLGTSSALTSLSVSTNFVCRTSGVSHAAVVACYLYDFDPTGGTTPPANYLGVSQATISVPYYGVHQTFNFSGLNITSNKTLYFFFLDANESPYADDIYSMATGNGYTATPSVYGTFKAGTQTLTVSPATVNTGSSVTISVTNATGSLTATIKYGSTTLATKNFTGGSTSIPCPASWFATAGVTSLTSITLSVTVTGGNSTLSSSFTLSAGSDMRPTIDSVTSELVQGDSASGFTQYIANISRAKLKITATAKSGATISYVRVQQGSNILEAAYNSSSEKYEVVTAILTGNTDFIVQIADSRGYTASSTFRLSGVVAYQPPALQIEAAYRCDINGNATDGGLYYRVKANAIIFTALNGNAIKQFTCQIKGSTNIQNLTSGVLSPIIFATMDSKISCKVIITLHDAISTIVREVSLPGIARNVVITRSDNGTNVGIGMTPQNVGGSSVQLPASGSVMVGDASFGHKIIITTDCYGSSLPASGVEGQIFFQTT